MLVSELERTLKIITSIPGAPPESCQKVIDAFLSNFKLCGVYDELSEYVNLEKFKSVYESGMMNMKDLHSLIMAK